tara:strand:- start:741 stop:1328 length:588 start_codon:yes stop_codon:yes gene_type:complete
MAQLPLKRFFIPALLIGICSFSTSMYNRSKDNDDSLYGTMSIINTIILMVGVTSFMYVLLQHNGSNLFGNLFVLMAFSIVLSSSAINLHSRLSQQQQEDSMVVMQNYFAIFVLISTIYATLYTLLRAYYPWINPSHKYMSNTLLILATIIAIAKYFHLNNTGVVRPEDMWALGATVIFAIISPLYLAVETQTPVT